MGPMWYINTRVIGVSIGLFTRLSSYLGNKDKGRNGSAEKEKSHLASSTGTRLSYALFLKNIQVKRK